MHGAHACRVRVDATLQAIHVVLAGDRPSPVCKAGMAMAVGRGWVAALRMDLDSARRLLASAERRGSPVEMASGTQSLADLLRSLLAFADDEGTRSLAHAVSALRSARDPMTAYGAIILCRASHWLAGNLRAFELIGRNAPPVGGGRRTSVAALMERSVEAAVEMQQLRLPMADRLSRDVLEAARRSRCAPAIALLPTVVRAQLAYERGDLAEADAAIRSILPRVRECGTTEIGIRAYTTLARAAIRQRRCEFAVMTLREGEALGCERGWSRLNAACLAERVELYVALGRGAEARAAFDKLLLLGRPANGGMALHLELARCRIGTPGGSGGEVGLIRRLRSDAVSRGDLFLATLLGVRLVAALVRTGEDGAAGEVMLGLVEVGCDAGLYQTLLDGDPEVSGVLRALRPRLRAPHHRAYVATLLEHWPAAPAGDVLSPGGKRSEGALTPRERNVLHLMSLGHSNKRIAQRLGIAPETVKSHAKNIFVRLGSATRAEAVCRATSLGMI